MASIEFGVVEQWSDISLIPSTRVDLDEEQLEAIRSILSRFTQQTGIEFDTYSSASIPNPDLPLFIDELETASGTDAMPLAQALILSARQAQRLDRPLRYNGL